MHYTRQQLRQARKEANRLFRNLRLPVMARKEAIRIIYPQRFPRGEGIIAMLVPTGDGESLAKLNALSRAHAGYHCPPAIINNGGDQRIRIVWRFPKVCSCDGLKLFQLALIIAKWAEDLFGRKAIICPDGGLVAMRIRLRIG